MSMFLVSAGLVLVILNVPILCFQADSSEGTFTLTVKVFCSLASKVESKVLKGVDGDATLYLLLTSTKVAVTPVNWSRVPLFLIVTTTVASCPRLTLLKDTSVGTSKAA